jgi:hypothetical protein
MARCEKEIEFEMSMKYSRERYRENSPVQMGNSRES